MGSKPNISLGKIKQIIKTSILADYNKICKYVPILIEGASGIGKTSAVNQVVGELTKETNVKFDLYDFRAGQTTAQDLYGIPFPITIGNNEKGMVYLKESGLPGTPGNKLSNNGIFFIDELTTTTDEPLMSGLLQLLTDRKIAGYHLPEKWYIVAAANRRTDGNIYHHLPFPVRNRMEIYNIDFSRQEMIRYAESNKWHKWVIDYLKAVQNDSDIISYDAVKEMDYEKRMENYVCATPRSWEYVNDKIKMYEKISDRELKENMWYQIAGLIGVETTKKFKAYTEKEISTDTNFSNTTGEYNVQVKVDNPTEQNYLQWKHITETID